MRYRTAENLEIICLVEWSSLSVRRTLEQLGIPRATFYRWYQRYFGARRRGPGEMASRAPRRVWNKLPKKVRLHQQGRHLNLNPMAQLSPILGPPLSHLF
jgi:hypothetical protein